MVYQFTELQEELIVNKIVSIHYFEYMSDFSFPGESHSFWEFLCVDKGEVKVKADREIFTLKQGEIIFHKPNEFHTVAANGVIAPNLVVIGFECGSPSMAFFRDKILSIGESERNLMAGIIAEARKCFSGVLDDPYMEKLERASTPPFGGEQMIKIHLEQLLIQLFRQFSVYGHLNMKKTSASDSDQAYEKLIIYLENHIRFQLTIETICKDNLIGSSQLKKLFRERNNCGVIETFNQMKIGLAKQLIRNRQMNFTQIADYLGYSSIHYFSRQFKKVTGMTPTEYRSSIIGRSENPYHKHLEL